MSRALLGAAFASVLVTASVGAHAQGNDRSAPTGGRSALMGNTGVALGRDGAAPFLNPATIVGIGDQSVAFSVNFFTLSYQHYSDWHQPDGTDASRFGPVALSGTSESNRTFKALPSTLCLFLTVAGIGSDNSDKVRGWRAGKQKLALCLGSLEAQDVGLPALAFHGTTAAGATAQVQSLNRTWNRLSIGPTYSVALSDSVSVGASLHGVSTADSFALNGSAITATPGGGALQSVLGTGGSGHAIDVVAILGGTWRNGPFTIGASAQVPALHLYGKFNGVLDSQYATGGTNTATLASGTGDFRAPPPIRLALGAGMESKRLVLEADASYDLGQHEAMATSVNLVTSNVTTAGVTTTSSSATYVAAGHGVVNAGAGGEYFLSPTFSVVGGLSTSLTSLRALQPTMTIGNLAPARSNTINLSIGVGSYGKAGELMIGTQLGYGWGQAVAINPYVVPNQFAVIDTQTYSALIVLAGTTNLRTLGRAVKSVEEVVTEGKPEDAPKVQPALLDPGVAPAGTTPTPPRASAAPPARPASANTNTVPAKKTNAESHEKGAASDANPKSEPSDAGASPAPAPAKPKTSPTDPPSNAPDKATPAKPSVLPPN